jgi:hypothetical protein
MAARARSASGDDEAVSPVIGTILLLAITAVSITVVMYAGKPILERLSDEGALDGMVGQFQVARSASMQLAGADAARSVPVQLAAGDVSIVDGGRVAVTVDRDNVGAFTSCDFHVSGWAYARGAMAPNSLSYSASGCRAPTPAAACTPVIPPLPPACVPVGPTQSVLEAWFVRGPLLQGVSISFGSGTLTKSSGTFDSASNWMFRLTNGDYSTATSLQVYAEAWLLHTDELAWGHTGKTSTQTQLVAGAIVSSQGGATYLDSPMAIEEEPSAAGTHEFSLHLPTLEGSPDGSINDPGRHQILLSLASAVGRDQLNDASAASEGATRLRLDFSGPAAGDLCQALVFRNSAFASARYAADAMFPCATGDSTGQRSVSYSIPSVTAFEFSFLHAEIHASLQL